MTTPTPEERAEMARQLYETLSRGGHTFQHARFERIVTDHIKRAIAAARALQLEEDCRAVCAHCRDGAAKKLWSTDIDEWGWWHETRGGLRHCDAATIRAGGEKESTNV